MAVSNPLEEILEPLAGILQRHVLEATRAALASEAVVKEVFRIAGDAPDACTFYCLIPNSNADYHAQLAIGLSKDALPALFPGEADPRFRLDALGRLGEMVSSRLTADEAFIGRFGRLKSSVPFFSEGAYTDRKDAGIRGKVTAKGTDLAFRLTVRPAGPETWAPG